MQKVKFRCQNPALRVRRTKLEIPGWAGERKPRANRSQEQVWHCLPFSEGAQYGLELIYAYENEMRATTRDGKLYLEGDFGPPLAPGLMWPPFRNFGERFFTYQLLLDLDPGSGWAIRTEPHPRFYSDTTGTVPIAVPALIRSWWPIISFLVFKSPSEGQTHVFRPGEPFAQILIIPEEANFELSEMTDDENADRELRSRRIHAARETLAAQTQWSSSSEIVFDGTYRHMLRAAKEMKLSSSGDDGGGDDGGNNADGGGGDDDGNSNRTGRVGRPPAD